MTQAVVLKVDGNQDVFQCGAVLVDHQHVLTVAHCVAHFYGGHESALKVRLGEWDTQKDNEFLPHEDFKVIQMHLHEYFKNNSLWNDIAVLKLDRKVTFAPNIDTICLPRANEVFDGQNCVTTGWGKTAYRTYTSYFSLSYSHP